MASIMPKHQIQLFRGISTGVSRAAERKDYYKILGVPRDSSQKEIKAAYIKVRWAIDPVRLV